MRLPMPRLKPAAALLLATTVLSAAGSGATATSPRGARSDPDRKSTRLNSSH